MPRLAKYKIPLPVYKASPNFLLHSIRRNRLLDDLRVRFPIYKRLPEFWRKQFEADPPMINQVYPQGTKRPGHSGLWVKNEAGLPEMVKPIPIRVDYTKEVKAGLWGGEGIVTGFKYARSSKMSPRFWKTWKPYHWKQQLYSEVLERSISTVVTARTLDLVDAAYGFDHYILKTPTNELCSDFGSELKREMLLRLHYKDTEMYKNDPEKRDKIYKRYEKYLLPKDEAEWVGLSLKAAMWKQWNKEKEAGIHDPVPLLEVYTKQLKEKLEKDNISSDKNVAENVTVFHAPGELKS